MEIERLLNMLITIMITTSKYIMNISIFIEQDINEFVLNEISKERTEIDIVIKGPWLSGKIIIEGPMLNYISNLVALEEAYKGIQN